jgi:hypothetical protein
MIMLHILTEELSCKKILEALLPKVLPGDVHYRIYPHQGREDLKKALNNTVPHLSKTPDARIVVLHDQDQHNCKKLKKELLQILESKCLSPFLICIVCRELENWYLGDLEALKNAYPRFKVEKYQSKKILRNIDRIQNAPQLILSIVPELSNRKTLPKLEIAEKIADHLSLEKNKSVSFNYFFKGLQKLLMMNQYEL